MSGIRRMRSRCGLAAVMVGLWLTGTPLAPAGLAGSLPELGSPGEGQIEASADRLNYDREHGVVEGIGHAVLKRGDVVLRADYVRVNTETQEAHAFGEVSITRGTDVWTGSSITYNFQTGAGLTPKMEAAVAPFYVKSEQSERTGDGRYILQDAWVTTCNPETEPVDFHVTARRLEVVPSEYIKARGAVWWFGGVPCMYIPYWYRDLDGDFGWQFIPGYSSDDGAFLLSSYHYRITPGLKGRTHLDYRTERGVAGGQDFKWNYGDDQHVGNFKTYYADDQDPIDPEDVTAGDDITADRYRIRLHDSYSFTDRDLLFGRAQYLSDPDVLEDFFDKEFREERQPDNYADYTHRGDLYTANILARSRLNDFYSNVNRLPEASTVFFRQPIGESDIYYEGQTAAAYLEQVFPKKSASEKYDSFRLDSQHTVYRPAKHFGFLTLIPRAGARGTYYSQTRRTETTTQASVVTVTNTTVDASGATVSQVSSSTTTNTVTRDVPNGADGRGSVELGFETSYKAFGLYDTAYGPRRHIIEPFANYTFIPEPNLTPADLYQFDEVDQLAERNDVRLGVRNKWQERRDSGPSDLIDAEVSTIVNIHRPEGQDTIENLYFDTELRPVEDWAIDFDGTYNIPNGDLTTFNSWLTWDASDQARTRLEYRYRQDDSSLLFGDLTLFPKSRWTYNGYARYEFEQSRMEEVGGYIQHIFHCVGLKVGSNYIPSYTRTDGTEKKDEYRAMVEFWLTAFPGHGLGGNEY